MAISDVISCQRQSWFWFLQSFVDWDYNQQKFVKLCLNDVSLEFEIMTFYQI